MKIFPSSSIKKLDAYTIENEPIASIDLMERAATVLTKAITDRWNTETPVTIFAGPGNNGGDALAVARMMAEKGYKIFIIGGKDGIAAQAKEKLESKHPKIQIVGTYAPPFGFEKDEKELNHINQMISDVKPDLLIACFGCPKQEKWIYENIGKYDAKVSVCAGATVDFLAGNVKRAPRWMSEHGLEWFYRFLQEPKRMFKRYFINDIKIVNLIRKYR